MSENIVNSSKLKIIPLGGLEEIGMNITAFEYGDSIIVVDCGLSFPADDMLGIDLVIPDVSYLKDNLYNLLNNIPQWSNNYYYYTLYIHFQQELVHLRLIEQRDTLMHHYH